MSLINDALKRASEVKPPAPAAEPETPMRVVQYQQRPILPLVLCLTLLVLLAAAAGWLFFKGWQAERAASYYLSKAPVAARELPTDEAAAKPAARTRSEPAGSVAPQASASPAAPMGPVPTNAAAATEPVKPSFPSVRLQGIFYRPSHPSAMINSKSVSVGEKVAGTKV